MILLTASLLPNANTFVQQLLTTFNDVSSSHPEVQDFLGAIHTKVSTLETSDQHLPITAFYISLILRDDPGLANCIAPNFTQNLPADLAIDYALFLTVRALQRKGTQDYPAFTFLPTFLAIDESICADPHLWQSLQDLKVQLPDESADIEALQAWYQQQGPQWQEDLQAVMVKYRGFQPQWFNGLDTHGKLKEYYGVLQTLVECLYGDCYVSPPIQTDLEAQLFGPKKVFVA